MEKKTSSSDDDNLLPKGDFFIQILVYLPVKSLLRFKSVCKSWHTLIESSFFINLHIKTFNSASSSFKFGTFILQSIEHAAKYEDDIKLYMLSSGSRSGSGDGEDDIDIDIDIDDLQGVFKVDDLGFLPFYKYLMLTDTLRMVGSCNGIICLHDSELMDDSKGGYKHHYSNLRDVSLWNPATRQFRTLPKSIPIEERNQQNVYIFQADFVSFGFDVKTKDYKVLRITPFQQRLSSKRNDGCMCRVQVYSLSSDSWRLLEGINYLPILLEVGAFQSYHHGIYLNGSYFFVGINSQSGIHHYKMLSFDFTKEVLTTVQLPDNNYVACLSYLGDKIVVFTTPSNGDDGYEYYDIWVLNEKHGSSGSGSVFVVTKESWTKLHSLQLKSRTKPGYYNRPRNQPQCISNNGEFVLISTQTDDYKIKLQLFNLVTKETKKEFRIGDQDFRADVYKESLVSIMGGNVLLRMNVT